MKRKKYFPGGFTLVEIMVSLAVSSLVIGGIYGVYTIQQRSYKVQEQITEMQQRVRSALDFMVRDMRLANFNPNNACGLNSDQYGLIIREAERFSFEYCEGTALQQISYSMNNNNLMRELIVNGIGQSRSVAEGVDGIEFRYLQGVKDDGTTDLATSAKDTRIVRISILVRSTYPDPNYTDSNLYTPSSGTAWTKLGTNTSNPPNDHFHRRLFITSITLRNVGL